MTVLNTELLTIGSRVWSMNNGAGTIFEVHGEPAVENILMLDGGQLCTTGAGFDIVFDAGRIVLQVAESTLRRRPWRILGEPLEKPQQIAMRLAWATSAKASEQAKRQEAKAAFDAEVARLKTAPEFQHLEQVEQGEHQSCGKLAAANIRKELKRIWPEVKFSVRKTAYGTVAVAWEDGPDQDLVAALLSRHRDGHFNSSEDLYEHASKPFGVAFGEARHIIPHRSVSLGLINQAIDSLFAGKLAQVSRAEAPQPENYLRGELRNVFPSGWGFSFEELIRDAIQEVSAQ
ncbi:LPD29 domain-containing protein [Chromobacterium fluminis]|nr:LPD29 domain-containing protein [Chromobacterium haemolyticum]